jgi:hypothetical protein
MSRADPFRGAHLEQEPLQLAAQPLRTYVGDKKGGRFRPVMCVVVGARSKFCFGMDLVLPDQPVFEAARKVLLKTLRAARNPPNVTVQVRDPELATAMRAGTELAGVEFQVVDHLDAVDDMLQMMEGDLFPPAVDSPLSKKEISIDRLRAFADGCAAFYASQPWKHLHDDDLIEIESPSPPQGMRLASVLGAGGQVMGIGFFPDEKAYDDLVQAEDPSRKLLKSPRWSLMFHAPDELPPEDAELWEEHGLRVAADDAVPILLRYHKTGKLERPDGPTLTFVEGLCRAIAATTEPQLDSGRWEQTVHTFDGPVTYRLSIPHLLKPPPKPETLGALGGEQTMQRVRRMLERAGAKSPKEIEQFLQDHVMGRSLDDLADAAPASDRERALDLCYAAQDQYSRREHQMLREALRLDPDCAQAYVQLAERQSDPAEGEKIYRQAIEAGRRSLGNEPFNDPEYPFWGAIESRPFMRAMAGLAESLGAQSRLAEAADVLAEMLRLNRNDNQGVRYQYVPLLMALGRLDDAKGVMRAYPDDACALWDFAKALIEYKRRQWSDASLYLDRADQRNPFVIPRMMNLEDRPPSQLPSWSPGHPSEAEMIVDLLGEVWSADEAAMQWLHKLAKRRPPASRARSKRKGSGKRKKR